MKRVISLLLVVVMIFGVFSCVDLSAFATDVSVNNRAQWLSKLTDTFDMEVESDNYPDNYFSDLSSESEYYRDIMVATEFGLVDVEAGEAVDPDGDVTREFAAQTLNFCLGWTLDGQDGEDGNYTFSDSEDCLYPDDDQVAVNRGWLALDEDNKFLPQKEVTANEINTMLDDAEKTLKDDEIDENYDSTFEYNDGVIEIPEGTIVEFGDNSVEIFSKAYTIKENDTIVVYTNGIPVVYTAKKVTTKADSIIVQTSDENTEEAIKDVDMQTAFDVDASGFVPADGFEIVDNTSHSSSVSAKAKAKNSISLKKEIPMPGGNKITLDISIKNIKFATKEKVKNKEVSAKLSFDLALNVSAEFNFTDIGDIDPDDLDMLGKIPIGGIGFVEFKPELNFNGKTSLEQTYHVVTGFSKDSKGFHNLSSFKKGNFTYIFEGSCKFGIKVEAGVTIVVVKAGIYAEVGMIAKAQAKRTVDKNGNNLFCISLGGYLYFTIGAEITVDLLVWKTEAKIEWEIFKEDNSPLRLYFHIENGKAVNKCTADSTQYVTPADSKYGRPATDENGNYDFYETSGDYIYTLNGDEATISGYSGTAANVMIPTYIDGHLVIAIGDNAFYNKTTIKKVIIPNSVTSIGNYAFYNCSGLTNITIPNSVTSIGKSAFLCCSSLTSITIPDSVTRISISAFSGCSSLTRVNIPNSVTIIGGGAFSGCSSLTSITIPDSVTNIEFWVFSGCRIQSLSMPCSASFNGAFDGCYSIEKLTLTKGTGTMSSYGLSLSPWESANSCLKTVVIEDGVKNIGKCAFLGCIRLTSITIPNSVTNIDDQSFERCSSLTSITIPNSVTRIGWCAFEDCSSLTSINIPNSVTSISTCAFSGCSSLTSINIPNSLTSIGDWAFEDCSSLTNVTIGNSVTSIGNEAFYGCSGLADITIPDSVTSIGNYAFYNCSGLKELTMPCSAKIYNSQYTFGGCTNIEKVTLTKGTGTMQNYGTSTSASAIYTYYQYTPWYISNNLKELVIEDGVKNIGTYAFYGCSGLTSIAISDSVTSIGSLAFYGTGYYNDSANWDNNVLYIGNHLIKAKDSISGAYKIESGTKTIASDAFYGCSKLTSITIPDSVKSIGDWAFEYCSSLTNVTIGNSVTSIGNEAFYGCSGLADITIPDSVTSIGSSAFSGCSSMTSATISESVEKISEYAFSNCVGLKELKIPASARMDFAEGTSFKNCLNVEKVTLTKGSGKMLDYTGSWSNNGDYNYYKYTPWYISRNNFKELVFEAGIENVGTQAFCDCTSLTSVTIPNSVTSIGEGAFDNCSSLNSIIIPDSVTSIGSGAFYNCDGLTSIDIPDSVKSISDYAFHDCSSLTSITIPDSVTSIGSGAFRSCSSLTSITIPDSVTSIEKDAFEDCNSLTSITIGDSITNIDWVYYSDSKNLTSVTIGNSVTSIGDQAFSECEELKNITIPDSVTSIGNSAFVGCSSLTSVTIGNSVKSIGDYAFNSCGSLTSVTIPNSVTSIGDGAFSVCNSLTSVTIGNSVKSIGGSAFKDCSLKRITIPNSVTFIGEDAFKYCWDLTDVYFTGSQAQWNAIKISNGNDDLTGKKIHFNYNPNHIHSYKAVVTAPKANAVGFTRYKCSCGEWKKDATGNILKDNFTAQTGKVTGLKCVARTAGAQKFTWTAIKGVGGYQIQLLDASGKEVQNRLKVAKTNVYTYADLKVPGYAYKVKVRTFIKASDGNYYFGPWSAVLNSPTLPNGTALTGLARAKKAFTAKWKKGACTGYQLQFGRKSNFKGAKTVTFKNVKTVKYTAKKLAANKYYFVRIRTYKKIAGKNYFSKWSKTYKVKTK